MPIARSASNELLHAALGGLEYQIAAIDRRIAEIRAELGTTQPAVSSQSAGTVVRKRRPFSAASRKRMAAAQRERWAKANHATPAPAKTKRKISAAGKRRIIEATKARWAAWRAAQTK
jgi:hypothetical protein